LATTIFSKTGEQPHPVLLINKKGVEK